MTDPTSSSSFDSPAAPSPMGVDIPTERPPEQLAAETLVNGLPTYAQGLLRIRVPVRVTLAAQRKSIQEIIELGPGSILKFEKTCDEPLELMVGDCHFASGEVVKVGDKFGLRIGGRTQR
jgi:flagellar motor switch protein FliN/FliY